MRKQIALFSWWLDSAAQLTMLLGAVCTAALGWWLLSLGLLSFLGVWQLGSGIVWGVIQRDIWRLQYVGAAVAYVLLITGALFWMEPKWPEQVVQVLLVMIGSTAYIAAWVFLVHTHHSRPGQKSESPDEWVPNPLF